MKAFHPIAGILALAILASCEPGQPGFGSTGASQADYERHKANRKAYMYQGI